MGMQPLITRPSRVTTHSATLIDNIYTNVLETGTVSGLLINDITDHLPVFATCDWKHTVRQTPKKIYKRIRNEERLIELEQEMMKQNWNKVFIEKEANRAYEAFLLIFKTLYDKHCPAIEIHAKQNREKRPWLTKSLINACRKKNSLCKQFLKVRLEQAEMRYKRYRNKLNSI